MLFDFMAFKKNSFRALIYNEETLQKFDSVASDIENDDYGILGFGNNTFSQYVKREFDNRQSHQDSFEALDELKKCVYPNFLTGDRVAYDHKSEKCVIEPCEGKVCYLSFYHHDDNYTTIFVKTIQEIEEYEYLSSIIFRVLRFPEDFEEPMKEESMKKSEEEQMKKSEEEQMKKSEILMPPPMIEEYEKNEEMVLTPPQMIEEYEKSKVPIFDLFEQKQWYNEEQEEKWADQECFTGKMEDLIFRQAPLDKVNDVRYSLSTTMSNFPDLLPSTFHTSISKSQMDEITEYGRYKRALYHSVTSTSVFSVDYCGYDFDGMLTFRIIRYREDGIYKFKCDVNSYAKDYDYEDYDIWFYCLDRVRIPVDVCVELIFEKFMKLHDSMATL